MYKEKASFIDKLINALLSPFDRFFFKSNHHIGDDSYMQILNGGKDISKLSEKWLKYYYLHIHSKLYEIMCGVYDGYDNQPDYVFVAVDPQLDDLYLELWNTWLVIDRYPFIEALKFGQFNYFKSLNYDPSDRIKMWRGSKKYFVGDIESIGKELSLDPLPNDLKLAFTNIDKLLSEHIVKKNKVLYGEGEYAFCSIRINFESHKIYYRNKEIIFSYSDDFKLLHVLLKNRNTMVSDVEIAKFINENVDTKTLKNKDVARDIQFIKRDLGNKLARLGIEKADIEDIKTAIERVSGSGYIIRS